MGAISQFRMYTEPPTAPQIQHNFRVLKIDTIYMISGV